MTAAGRALPPEWAALCRTLRELRAETGLSLVALAAKSPYSKSSWERYLNGRTLPPRQAVERLCVLAGTDPRRALAQWELAETAWSGRAGEAGAVASEGAGADGTASGMTAPDGRKPDGRAASDGRKPDSRASDGRASDRAVPVPGAGSGAEGGARWWSGRRAYPWVLGAVALVVVATTLTVLLRPGPSAEPGPAGGARPATTASAVGPGCHGPGCTGKDVEDLECSNFAEPPTTLGEQRLDGTVVKVRHSAVCETVWARIDRGTEGDVVEVLVPGGRTQRTVVRDRFDASASISTPMAAAAGDLLTRVRACLVRDRTRHCFTASDHC
ncbi:helix-turn-helix domain-containing protein [Streptomyces sp. NPDC001478]